MSIPRPICLVEEHQQPLSKQEKLYIYLREYIENIGGHISNIDIRQESFGCYVFNIQVMIPPNYNLSSSADGTIIKKYIKCPACLAGFTIKFPQFDERIEEVNSELKSEKDKNMALEEKIKQINVEKKQLENQIYGVGGRELKIDLSRTPKPIIQ